MPAPEDSLLDPLKRELRRLGSELGEAGLLRWQLARIELAAALVELRRLVILLACALGLFFISLPVLVVLLAEGLAAVSRHGPLFWMTIAVAVLWALSAALAWLGWRRFGRRFLGLEQTLEQLQEDIAWLRECYGRGDGDRPSTRG